MEFLNLIPLAFLAWVVVNAVRGGMRRDWTDRYFQENKGKTGKKFANFFGVPVDR